MYTSSTDDDILKKEALETLEIFAREYKIFIDTCSMAHPAFVQFLKNITPLLKKYDNRLIVPLRCIEELQKLRRNPEVSQQAKAGLIAIAEAVDNKLAEIRGEASDNFADNVFQTVFTKFRLNYRLLLITQDKHLAEDILKLNDSSSVVANYIHVRKIDDNAFLTYTIPGSANKHLRGENKKPRKNEERFRICKEVTRIPDEVIDPGYIPGEGETVYVWNKPVKLIKKLGDGGEGTTYETDTFHVAKIYKRGAITKRKYEKLKLMLTLNVDCEGICYPSGAVYNQSGSFIGYTMPMAKGRELQRSVFIKPLFTKYFPDWKKKDTVQLCITILEKIDYLHQKNILIGDINPSNIMVVSPKEVYFVDTDSYQVEDFPCPVGTVNYTAPEIQRKHFNDFLRTMGNENFAVATLLFMIMLPGKPPYSQQGGANPAQNIINMDFSYPFGESSNKKTPDGPWRYIWSHLTYDVKEAFYCTFKKGEKYSQEKDRLSAYSWLKIFRKYLTLLENGSLIERDEMSGDLFPTRFKKMANVNYITCRLCKNEEREDFCKDGICQNCLAKGETYNCKRCGKEIFYSNYDKYIRKSKRYETCKECGMWEREVRQRIRCTDCGEFFTITNREYEWYISKGKNLPRRCKKCNDYGHKVCASLQCYSCGKYFDITNDDYKYYMSKGNFPKRCPECRKIWRS